MTKARDLGDNAQNTKPKVVNAKADLIVGTGSDAADRLAVGSNGETLVADSSTTTGLRWQGNFAAGKNKIINGDFGIWQRGTSFSNPSALTYTADRWRQNFAGTPTTWSVSRQAFTAGTAPVAGYESAFFYRSTLTTVGTLTDYDIQQPIEDVRTFANQTVTLSFWAKADSARSSIVYLAQNFGSGGSAEVVISTPSISYTTSWQRFSFTFSVPSVSGKTIGAGSSLLVVFRQAVANGSVLDIWGVQVEAGSVATPFTTATGTLAGEFAAACRYFQRLVNGADSSIERIAIGQATALTTADFVLRFPAIMRSAPTLTISAAGDFQTFAAAGTVTSATAITGSVATPRGITLGVTSNNLVAGNATQLRANSASATLDLSAEL